MTLFNKGTFTLHSGLISNWKIDCDALVKEDYEALAVMALEILPHFGEVEGVPRGGLEFAKVMSKYITQGPRLIVDDVLTTGDSMEKLMKSGTDIGLVIFARGLCPPWIRAIWKLGK